MSSASRFASGSAGFALFAGAAFGQPLLAPTPPMGWNSWDSFGTGVTEDEVKANADYMASKLAKAGWQYIVVDIQWSEPNPQSHGYRPNAELAMESDISIAFDHNQVQDNVLCVLRSRSPASPAPALAKFRRPCIPPRRSSIER
jgi:hypothetical protein